MRREIYADHAATTAPAPEVVEAMLPYLGEGFGNASSVHRRGEAAREAVEDAVKAVSMFAKLEVPVLGVIENMSSFVCPHCGETHDIFGAGTVEERSRRWAQMGPGPAGEPGLPFLGAIPIHPDVRAGGDQGRPVVIDQPESDYSRALRSIAGRLAQQVSIATIGAGGPP